MIGLGAALALAPSGDIFVGHNVYDECRTPTQCPEHPTAAYLARYDSSGMRLSEQIFTHPGGLVRIHGVAVAGDDLVIAGMLTSSELLELDPSGVGNIHAARLGLDGTPRKLYRAEGNLIVNDVAASADGLVRVAGYTEGAVSWGGAQSKSFGDWDAFIVSIF